MKRFMLWAIMFTLFIPMAFADATISYVGCTPASGSSVSSFDFTLEFNYDGVVETLGDGDYGIGWNGFYNAKLPTKTQAVELYEGDRETGECLSRIMTSNVRGTSADFKLGNKVEISFPDIIPIKGKTYNIYISNSFNVYKKGEVSFLATNSINFSSNNLVLTFIGDTGSSESLSIESTSLRSQQDLDVMSTITYAFNNPISVSSDAKVQLKEGESVIATSTKCEQTDEKSVTFSFDNVELLLSHSYVLALPEGTVSMASDSNQKNQAFNITLNGSLSKLIDLGTVTPSTDQKQILSSVKASFNVPNGYKFNDPEGLANKYVAKLYQSEISEENLLASMQGEISQGNTVVWTLPSMSLIPETKYILYVPEGQFWVYDTNNKRANEYSNKEVNLVYTTPTREEAGYAPMEFGEPTLNGSATVVKDGDVFASISYLNIAPPNLKYEYDGKTWGFVATGSDLTNGYLYDITDETPVLVKEFSISIDTKETATQYYNVLRLNINSVLYEGREYRIEIPEGAFTIGKVSLQNYVCTPAFSLTVKGSTPTEINLISTSIEDGTELSSLGDVVFKFNGDLAINPESKAQLFAYDSNDALRLWSELPVSVYSFNNETSVAVHASSATLGTPMTLRAGYRYKILIPENSVYVASMPEIANKETVLNIKGVEAPPVITEPEYVSYTIAYMNPLDNVDTDAKYNSEDYTVAYSSSNDVVKGKSITLKFDTDAWKVVHLVRFNGDTTTGNDVWEYAETGIYTSSPLNDKARFEVVMSYKDNLVFSNISTGIAELEDLKVRVYSSGDNIVIDGLTGGEHITVYTATGIVIGTHDAAASYDTVNISAPTGQAYIVRIQRGNEVQAAKIMH